MEGSVNNINIEVDQRIACENTGLCCFTDTVFDRLDEFLRNRTANDLVDDCDTMTAFHRGNCENTVTVLTASTGLTDKFGILSDFFEKCFAVGDFRFTGICFHFEFTFETVNDDFQVKFTHTGNNGLSGFGVAGNGEGRVFFSKSNQSCGKFISVRCGCRFNRNRDNRFREGHGFQTDRMLFITECITCCNVLETNCCSDVTAEDFIAFFTGICMHLKQTTETFGLGGTGVVCGHTANCCTGINTEEVEFTNERVGSNFECQSGERFIVTAMTDFRFLGERVGSLGFPDINRRGQIIGNSVQERLNTFVLECGSAEDRNDVSGNNALTESFAENFLFRQFAFEECHHDIFIIICCGFDCCAVGFLSHVNEIFRNGNFSNFVTIVAEEVVCFLFEDINDSEKVCFFSDRKSKRNCIDADFFLHVLNDFEEICPDAVHLIDECNTGHIVFLCLSPDCF